MTIARPLGVALALLAPQLAMAADFDGRQLSALWGIPFAGILLSIALMPLLAPHFWHHHFGKVAAAWALAFLVPFAVAVRAGRGGRRIRARAAGRVHPLRHPADGAVHRRRAASTSAATCTAARR